MQTSPHDDLHPTIVHAHIFKNAGTSLDRIFEPFFGEAFRSFDLADASARIALPQITRFFHDNPGCRYLTSHQVGWPMPVYEHRLILPLVMLREPFDRIPSCFFFERDKQKKFEETITLEDYVRRHLDLPLVSATIGLQLLTLADRRLARRRRREALGPEAEEAARRALLGLPVFGIVEHFEQSVRDMTESLAPFFPGIEALAERAGTRENIGAAPDEARGAARDYLRDALTADTFARLEQALAPEIRLYAQAHELFESRSR